MAQVLYVYEQVQMLSKRDEQTTEGVAIFSCDEKPGIQAVENAGGELPPVPGIDLCWMRDYDYVRGGTLSLLAGIDLLTGHVHTLVAERHRSPEFIKFLQRVDDYYPPSAKIRMILDNHSTHLSKETRVYLASLPNRFEFIFTPKHGSWLNLVESLLAKMAKTFLRGIRVSSKEELSSRIEHYLKEINDTPVIFRWKDKLDTWSLI